MTTDQEVDYLREKVKLQDKYIKSLLTSIDKLRQSAVVDYVHYSVSNNYLDNGEALAEKISNASTGVHHGNTEQSKNSGDSL